jgi:hypothetical protein
MVAMVAVYDPGTIHKPIHPVRSEPHPVNLEQKIRVIGSCRCHLTTLDLEEGDLPDFEPLAPRLRSFAC